MSADNFSEYTLTEIYKRFHITDVTAKLLKDEGYTSVGLLRNIEAAGPEAVNDIPGLRGAQKMAVRAMLKYLVAGDRDNSSGNSKIQLFECYRNKLCPTWIYNLKPFLIL